MTTTMEKFDPEVEEKEVQEPKKKKKYVDNEYFEQLVNKYNETGDMKILDELTKIFRSITEKVYSMAVRNIYNNVGSLFPYPNSYDRDDLIQNALIIAIKALKYWQKSYLNAENKGKKSKAFNYFTCCIVFSIQGDLKKEIRKGWWKSDIFMNDFTQRYVDKFNIKIYRDYDNFVDHEN